MKFESIYNLGDDIYYVKFSKKQQRFLPFQNKVTYIRFEFDSCGLVYARLGLSRGSGCAPEDMCFKSRKEAFDFIEEMELNTKLLTEMRIENDYKEIE